MMDEHRIEQPNEASRNPSGGFLLILVSILLISTGIIFSSDPTRAEIYLKLYNRPIQDINYIYLPIIFRNQVPVPSETPTPTSTFTPTPSSTATPTSTGTPSTPTPTLTGTPPTPTSTGTPTATGTPQTPTGTATGTLTSNPRLSITVSPFQANVGGRFTFTIKVTNIGTALANNVILTDPFPDFINVESVSTTKGIPSRAIHSASVIIGTVSPGEEITITIIVRANNRKLTTETVTNTITLQYDSSGIRTASVSYRIIVTTLPGTGDLPLDWQNTSKDWVLVIQGALIGGLGLVLCGLGIWMWKRNSINKFWIMGIGTILLVISFVTLYTEMQTRIIGDDSNLSPRFTDIFGADISEQVQGYLSATPSVQAQLPAYLFATPEAIFIETLPSYPIPTPDITITPGPEIEQPDTSPVNRIIIPAIFLDTEVKFVPFDGISWLIRGLRHEVAWLGNTSWPGLGGNTVLAGHITVSGIGNGPFRRLDQLGNGEFVILHTAENTYTYRVRAREIVEDWDLSVTESSDKPQITLITCVEWDEEQEIYLKRLVLFADLVRVDPLLQSSSY